MHSPLIPGWFRSSLSTVWSLKPHGWSATAQVRYQPCPRCRDQYGFCAAKEIVLGKSFVHERPGGQSAFQIVRILAPRERTDRNVISVRISERELLRSSVRIEVWLLFEPTDERACPLQRQVE